MPKINLNNVDVDELVNPCGGHKGLLEGRKAMKSLYDSDKWEFRYWNRSSNTKKPKYKNIHRDISTRELSVIAHNARSDLDPVMTDLEIEDVYDLRLKDLEHIEECEYLNEIGWMEMLA